MRNHLATFLPVGLGLGAAAFFSTAAFSTAACAKAQAPTVVVPASASTANGNGNAPMPGAGIDARVQVLIGAQHFSPAMVGREIAGLRLRRQDARKRPASGGQVDLTVRLGVAASPAVEVSERFDANVMAGTSQTVFQGVVSLSSTTAPGPLIADWSNPGDALTVTFQMPYRYTGAVLCVELVGRAVVGAEPGPWTLDGVYEPLLGTRQVRGLPCGSTGEIHANPAELVGGSTVKFVGAGPSAQSATLLLGTPMAAFDLASLGLGAPGCALLVQPMVTMPAVYGGARSAAESWSTVTYALELPGDLQVVSAAISAQYVTLLPGTLELGNAVDCQVASILPTAELSMVFGALDAAGNLPTSGHVWSTRAPVIAFDLLP